MILAPQMSAPGFAGDRRNKSRMSSQPEHLTESGVSSGWHMRGNRPRDRVHASVNRKGADGLDVRMYCTSSLAPARSRSRRWPVAAHWPASRGLAGSDT